MNIVAIRKILVVIPQVVRVSAFIQVRQVLSIPKLCVRTPVSVVANLKVALRAKQDTVAKQIRASTAYRLPVMRLPTPVCPFGSVRPAYALPAGSTQPPLPVPSILYSVRGKRHGSTPRRIINGWKYNGDDMWVLMKDGKSTNIAVMYLPPFGLTKRKRTEYHIFHASKLIGYALSLVAAKRRAEAYLKRRKGCR